MREEREEEETYHFLCVTLHCVTHWMLTQAYTFLLVFYFPLTSSFCPSLPCSFSSPLLSLGTFVSPVSPLLHWFFCLYFARTHTDGEGEDQETRRRRRRRRREPEKVPYNLSAEETRRRRKKREEEEV